MIHKSNFENNLKNKGNTFNYYRLIIALLFIFAISVPTFAQNKQISLSVQNATLKTVFSQIEKQTPYRFSYREADIDNRANVNIKITDGSIDTVLEKILPAKNLQYSISSNRVMITPAQKKAGESKIRTGQIKDQNGDPIIGANVSVKGTTNGTITDIDGNFALTVSSSDLLQISYIGYLTQEIQVGNTSVFNIVLKEDVETLDEVVIIGYTSQKKGLLAGSVVTTKFDEGLTELPVASPSAVLAGKMSGVNISTPSGQPGSQPDISVRTGTTWNTSPTLYVIDGAVLDATAFKNLSSSEIESITVLKDAASAAVYGARSDAGVILVTTKKGKEGRPTINYTTNFSADFATQEVQLTNLYQTGMMNNQMYANYGLTAPTGVAWSDEELDWAKSLPGHGYNTLDAVWHTPYVMNHTLSISGGSEKIKYFGAANYYTQKGFMASTDYNKLNLRLNVTADITKDLQIYASISNTNTNTSTSPTEGTNATYEKSRMFTNYMPTYSTDGSKYIGDGWAYGNPAAAANGASGYNDKDWMNPIVNVSITYKLPWVKGLSLKASYMGSWENTREKKYRRTEKFYYPVTSGENSHIKNVDDMNLTKYYESSETASLQGKSEWWTDQQLNFQASYDRTFGKHHVNGTFVYEATNNKYYGISNERKFFPLYQTDQYWAASSSHDDMSANGGPDTESGRASYVWIGGYAYDNKYIFNFSMRYDGSMKFAPSERWGLFPAASAAWVVSSEPFLMNNKKVTYLKLRASIGLTGNDAIGGWQWQESYSSANSYMFGESLTKKYGLKYGSLVNPFLTWEKSLSYNLAADYEFIGHLHGSVEYWHKHTYDILGTRQNSLPTTFSRSMPAENYGVVNAQGIDLSIGWRDRTGNVDWHANLTASYGWNKVIEKDYAAGVLDYEIPVNKTTNYITAYEGYIIRNEAQLNDFLTNNPKYGTGPNGGIPIQVGSFVYVDKSGPDGVPDGVIDKYDKEVLYANPNPINFGLNLGASWKNLSIEATFTGKLHNPKNFWNVANYNEKQNQVFNTEWLTNSWTPENPDALLPLMAPRDYRSYTKNDVDYWYTDASYIRLSNLNIGYTFNFDRPLGNAIRSIKLFATGTNLFYISNFKHWDPELSTGISGIGYPIMRTLGGGVSVNF